MTIKGIIFDLDGTLLYTLEDLKNSTNYALKKLNQKERSIEEIRNFVGNGIKKLIERALGDKQELIDECLLIFLNHYKNNSLNNTKPYENIVDILIKLKNKGIKLAVLSNKIDIEVKKLVDYYFKNIFDIVLGETVQFPKKPNSKASEYIIQKFNLKKEEVVFIGDSEVDIQTAENTEIKCLSVVWGYKDETFLKEKGAQKIFKTPQELYNFIINYQ